MNEFAVEFDQVRHQYGRTVALKDVSFAVPRGAILGLIGPNGSGKSTTLNIITGRLIHSAGTVRVGGLDIDGSREEIKNLIGYAPEEVKLYDGLSAMEFVSLSGLLHRMPAEQSADAAGALLSRFGIWERRDEQLGSYSKGMRRKALLAAAMVHEPEILILDEPLEGLDVIAQKVLKDLVRETAESGRTIIYSTHILEVLSGFCTHVVLLDRGDMLAFGPVEEVKHRLGIQQLADVFHRRAGS